MPQLVFAAIASLDGYVNDADGAFDWSTPDAEVHAFVNDLERPIGTHLYGRGLYEIMRFWETADLTDEPPEFVDYARIWRATDKVVYSSTLAEAEATAATARTRVERVFEPEAVRALVAGASADVAVGGPTLAAAAFAAGLVDVVHLLLSPIVVGGGTRALPEGVRLGLELVGSRRFAGGVVHLHYTVR